MKIFTQLNDLSQQFPRIIVALGTFDGLHIGHQQIISRAVELARTIDGTSVVFTFSNHPLSIVDPDRCPLQIVTYEDKNKLIEGMGVDILLTIPFTPRFLVLSPAEFIALLLKILRPVYIVVGPNYSFGYKGTGTPEMLKSAGDTYGFKTEIQQAVYVDDTIVSSTIIRQLIAQGNVHQAARLLGRPLQIKGTVITGDQRGRTLGYPTANLTINEGLAIPDDGVYVVQILIDKVQYTGVANVGTNPTFNGSERRIEIYILKFTGNLYGQTVTVSFLERIRGEITFTTAEQLKKQISLDIKVAEDYI